MGQKKKREAELEGRLRGRASLPFGTFTYTLRRIYGRLKAAIDKIVCLLDLFNSRGKVVFVRAHL